MRSRLTRVAGVSLLWALAACPPPADDDDSTGSGSGQLGLGSPCALDEECLSGLCQGGVCALPGDGGTVAPDAGTPDAGDRDAGPGDAWVPTGILAVDPDGMIEFGAVRLGSTVVKNVLVSNQGEAPFNVIQVGIRPGDSGGSALDFSVEPMSPVPLQLPPGGQLALRLRFTPSAPSSVSAFLSIASTAQNAPLKEIPLLAEFKGTGTVRLHHAVTDLGDDLQELDLGVMPLGDLAHDHVYVKNVGSEGSVLTVLSVSVDPPQSPSFSVRAGPLPRALSQFPGPCTSTVICSPLATDCVEGLCLASPDAGALPLDVIDVEITYAAASAGAARATLKVTASVGADVVERDVALSGTGQVGTIVVSPNPLLLGELFTGQQTSKDLTVRNSSNVPTQVQSISLSGVPSPFSLGVNAPVLPAPLGAGAALVVPVVFAPAAQASFADTLTITAAGGAQVEVPVSGSGVLPPSVQVPATLDFGNVNAGSAKQLPLTLGNGGPGVLRVTALALDAVGATPFSFSPSQVAAPVDVDGTATLQLTFAPERAAAESLDAELVVASNDPLRPEARVRLTGRAIGPVATLDRNPAVLEFGQVRVGTTPSPALTIRLTNTGVGPLQVSGVTAVLDAQSQPLPEFSLQPSRPLPTTVADGASDVLTFTLSYAPTNGNLHVGTFTLSTSDPGRTLVPVTVTGRGLACSANHVPVPTDDNGVCNGVCETTWADCNQNKQTDGCETSVTTSVLNCGGCNLQCSTLNLSTPACTNGDCTGACTAGFADCNQNRRADGCEVNTQQDPQHCGGCNQGCSANNVPTPLCTDGACTGLCSTGFADCNHALRADGCEVNTLQDPAHCGGCDQACSGSHVVAPQCTSGSCTSACADGYLDCNNNRRTDGCETNRLTDPDHCGACNQPCSAANVASRQCSGGACTGACNPGFADCDSNKLSNGCEINVTTNASHCGGCNQACSTRNISSATCGGGVCNGTCNGGFADCNGNKLTDGCETSTTNDANNCGGCNQACSRNNVSTPTCAGSACTGTCNTGFADCNANKLTDGCEINLTNDPDHCGGCLNAVCSGNHVATRTCANSVCNGTCTPGFANCRNGMLTDGCETDIATDPNNCGGCALQCSNNHIANPSCAFSACNGTCNTDYLDCNNDLRTDGCEVNRLTDNLHCGNCATACGVNEQCSAGVCIPTCGIKINEVQTGTSSNEFVELMNTCPTTINLRGYRIRYTAANGNPGSDFYQFSTSTDVNLTAGGYFVVGGSSWGGVKDATSTGSSMTDAAGGIGLFDAVGELLDGVAWGSTVVPSHPYLEGTMAPVPASGSSIYRHPNGYDSNHNSTDFVSTVTTPTPKAANP